MSLDLTLKRKVDTMLVPTVIEKTHDGERAYDLFSRILKDRIIYLNGEINENSAHIAICEFLFLENDAPGEEIKFYINSPGGSVSDGLALFDTINSITSPVITFGIGTCASMACVLLAAKYDRENCKRYVMPNCRVMAHQVRGGATGQASDILIEAKEMAKINKDIYEKLSKFTGQTYEKISKDASRDFWMSAEEAVKLGYADEIFL